jgi:site-specific recombinase XerD
VELQQAVKMYFYSLDLTPASTAFYQSALKRFVGWLGEHTCEIHPTALTDIARVDVLHMREYADWLRGRTFETKPFLSASKRPMGSHTLHGYCRVMRSFLNWAVREGLLNEVVTKRFRMPKRDKKVIQVFSDAQVLQLVQSCEGHYQAWGRWLEERDKAMLYLLVDTGMRRQEVLNLRLEDIHFGKEDAYALVRGKGRQQREIGLGVACRQQLYRYVHRYRPRVATDRVFVTRRHRPLGLASMHMIILRLGERGEYGGVRVSAHAFRHTFAYNYLKNGGDVMKLSLLMGHSSLTVTEGYLRAFQSREARKGLSVLDEMMSRRRV